MSALWLLVDALAAFRITWLVVEDYLTAAPRQWLIRAAYRRKLRHDLGALETLMERARKNGGVDFEKHPDAWEQVVELDERPPRLAYLWTCPWCAGLWVSAGVIVARHAAPGAWTPIAEVFAVAAVAALVAEYASKQHAQ